MPIVVACSCGKKYQVGDDKAGMKLRCKACQGVIPIPKPAAPADEFDDFGAGDDFGASGDFGGDDFDDQEPVAPRPKPSGKKPASKAAVKAKGKSKGGGKKSSKGKEMSPAVKYSLAGGIVVVTAGIVLGILYARGVIGGGKATEAKSGGDDAGGTRMASGDLVGDNPGGAPGNPPDNPGPPPKVKQRVPAAKSWTPSESWSADESLLGQTREPTALDLFPEYRIRVPRFLEPTTRRGKGQDNFDPSRAKRYMWRGKTRADAREGGFILFIGRAPTGKQFPLEMTKFFDQELQQFKKLSTTFKATPPESGRINGISFQRVIFEASGTIEGQPDTVIGFMYVGVDQTGSILIELIGMDHPSYASKTLPVMEAAVLSFKRETAGGAPKQPTSQQPTTPTAIAAADLLKQNPVDSKTLEKKTIRVQGTVARPLDQGGWLHLTGDGRRTVACLFRQRPPTSPTVGQTIVVEGTYFESTDEYITVGSCKLISAPKASGSSDDQVVRLDQYGDITSFALSPGGTTIVTCRNSLKPHKFQGRDIPGRAAEIRVWDVATSKPLATLEGPDSCRALSVAPRDGNIAAILASNPQQIVIWNGRTGKRLKAIPNTLKGKDSGEFQSVLSAHDGRAVYSYLGHSGKAISEDGKSTLPHRYARADVPTGELKAVTVFNRNLVMPMAASPTADVLAVGIVGRDKAGKAIGVVRLLDGKTGRVQQSLEFDGVPTGLSYSADGRRLAVAMRESKLAIVNLEGGRVEATLSTPVKGVQLFGYENAAVSADGTYVLVQPMHQGRPKVELWHVGSKKVYQLDVNSARHYGFTKKGRIVALSKSKLAFLKPEELIQQ